jgi:hypothetical protein
MTETSGTGTPPKAEASDHPDVSVLLKAATALSADGDTDGVIRWVTRAAEAAGEVGDDRRALELARAVADLKESLAAREHTPAPATRPPTTTMPPPPSARKPSLPPKPPLRHRSVPPTLPQTPAASVPPGASAPVDAARRNGASSDNDEAGATSVRVSVKSSVRDPDLLIVRILKKGETAPAGCGEAVLAPTGRGFDLGNLRG